MKKEFATKRVVGKSTTHAGNRKWWWIGAVAVLVIVISVGGFFAYKQRLPISPVVSTYVIRVKTWIAERKVRFHQEIKKVKQIAANKKNTEPEIHFEFYTALPNMQVTVPIQDDQATRNVNQTKPIKRQVIFSAKQLEQGISRDLQNQTIKQ